MQHPGGRQGRGRQALPGQRHGGGPVEHGG
jgi:hypothetical protein